MYENKCTQNKAPAVTAALTSIKKARAMSYDYNELRLKKMKTKQERFDSRSLILSSRLRVKKILRMILFPINYKKVNLTKL